MRHPFASSLLLAALLSGCGAQLAAPLRASQSGSVQAYAAQAQEPARTVTLLSASSDGQRASLEYAVLRGATPLRRKLSIDFNGEPQNPDAWQIKDATLNDSRLAKGALPATVREMFRQELAELKSHVVPQAAEPAPERAVQALPGTLVAPTRLNRVEFHLSADASRRALLDSVKRAEGSFYVETFIWHDDETGRELADALIARKREVEAQGGRFDVLVLVDAIGLRFSGGADRTILDHMKQNGLEVRLFSPTFFSGGRIAPLTHHKLYIADGSRVMTGGRNIGDEYLKETFQNAKGQTVLGWHDLLYTVHGEETGRIREAFFQNWERAGGKRPVRPAAIKPEPDGAVAVETITTDPHARRYGIREAHDRLIRNAEREIVAIYPYFSDDRLIKSLIQAKRQNPAVTIKVLLPGVRQVGKQGLMYELLNEESALQLLSAGAEIRMYAGTPGAERFSHFKGLAVDREVLSLGSANADARTYKNNHELNTMIQHGPTAADFHRQVVDPDWAVARPVTADQLKRSKLTRRVARKVLEFFDFLL
ncbi:MAG: phospholipase D-like domain-containing protein [Candidatus Sericytochromatia bacterium]